LDGRDYLWKVVWWGGEEFGRDKIEGIIGAGPAMGWVVVV
jgi:hypothetical protein